MARESVTQFVERFELLPCGFLLACLDEAFRQIKADPGYVGTENRRALQQLDSACDISRIHEQRAVGVENGGLSRRELECPLSVVHRLRIFDSTRHPREIVESHDVIGLLLDGDTIL